MEVEWRVAMRPGAASEAGNRERRGAGGEGEGVGESQCGAPFLRLKRLFGYDKSLPPSSIGGALPGVGEEHGTPGIAVRLRQPAQRRVN